MGATGVAWDNAMAESFFATLKTEYYYRRVWSTKIEAKQGVGRWIEETYNRRRRHSALSQIDPVTYEMQQSHHHPKDQQAAQETCPLNGGKATTTVSFLCKFVDSLN